MSAYTELLDEATQLIDRCESAQELESLRLRYLGKKGLVTQALKTLRELPADQIAATGKQLNIIKSNIQQSLAACDERLEACAQARLVEVDKIDVTLPGRVGHIGSHHPVSSTLNRIVALFEQLGFSAVEGPDIEDDYHNFTALNIPPDHPARAMHDTFYFGDGTLLRTHTSSVQVRHMEQNPPPYRIISPGRVYRRDFDPTHTPMFHQLEGLLVDRHVSFSDLLGNLDHFLQVFFDSDQVESRFRPSYFPFTEPSTEVDIRINDGDWIEVLGAGMVNPKVLENVGLDSTLYGGYAFGLGIERLAMLRYGIADLRYFFENDLRFLKQF